MQPEQAALYSPGASQVASGCLKVALHMLADLHGFALQASLAILPRARWSVLRGYAALHLLAMYVAVVAALPGLHVRQQLPHSAKHALRLLGLWEPRPAAMLPVLVAMLLVRTLWRV